MSDAPPHPAMTPTTPVINYSPDGATLAPSRWSSLRANLAIPLAIALLFPLGALVESGTVGPYNQRIVMLCGFNIILAVSLQLINGFSGQFSLGHAGFMAVGAYLAAYPAMNYSQRLSDPAASLLFFLALFLVAGLAGAILLSVFILLRTSRRLHPTLPGILLIAVLIWFVADLSQGSEHAVPPAYLVWSRGIRLTTALFSALTRLGLPVAASVSSAIPSFAVKGLSYVVLVIGAGCCAGAVGLVVGLPALRLRGDYLAIATLGLAEIIRIVIQNSEPLGGALGLTGIPKQTDFVWLYAGVIFTILAVWRLAYSAKGRAIIAVREDEIAAAAVGIDTTHYKVLAFICGAFLAGVAGAMFALFERSITPSYFGFAKSIEVVVMVTLGGLGSISGAVLAAIVLTLLPEVLRNISPAVAEYRMVLYASLLVLMMLVRPQGLLGGFELWPKRKGPSGAKTTRRDPVATDDRDDLEGEQATQRP